MKPHDLHELVRCLNSAVVMIAAAEGPLTARQVRIKSLLMVLRQETLHELAAVQEAELQAYSSSHGDRVGD
jgi:hypothetical protein